MEDFLQYDRMIVAAYRGVVRDALAAVAKRGGFPGDHHFYLTFRTTHAGVVLPSYLRAQYPEEMTIVLQYQFDNLVVEQDGFAVGLSFGGRRERLEIPFAAIAAFADPSANFALQFPAELAELEQDEPAPADVADEAKPEAEPAISDEKRGEVVALDAFRKNR